MMRNLSSRREDTRLRWRWLLAQLDGLDDDLAAEYLMQIDRGARFYDRSRRKTICSVLRDSHSATCWQSSWSGR